MGISGREERGFILMGISGREREGFSLRGMFIVVGMTGRFGNRERTVVLYESARATFKDPVPSI